MPRRLAAAVGVLALGIALGGCDARLWLVCSLGACGEDFDIFAPETPRDLRAEGQSRQVVLTWSSNRDDTKSYRIVRSSTQGEGHEFVEDVDAPIDRTDAMSYIDRGLANDTTYYYRLTALDPRGNESLPSIEASATPRRGAAPAAPRDLTATVGDTSIDLAWTGSEGAASYRVYRSAGEASPVVIAQAPSTRHRDLDVTPASRYRYLVTAVDADAQESAFSNAVTVVAGGTAPPPFVLAWGTEGSGESQFREPTDVAVGPEGDVYVADATLHRVQRFTPAGALQRTFGIDGGPCSGALVDPTALTVATTGTVYVTDSGADCVQMFNPDGSPAGAFGSQGAGEGQFEEASDIALDGDGNVYVTDDVNDTVQKFTSSGGFLARFTPGEDPALHVPFDAPTGIVLDSGGTMRVSSFSFARIWVVDPSGNTTATFGGAGSALGQLSTPQGLALDRDSRLYVADAGNHRVQAFTPAGAFVTRLGAQGSGNGQFDDPRGVATDCRGNLYVADTGNHRIQKFGSGSSGPCLGNGGLAGLRAFGASASVAQARKPGFRLRFTATGSRRGRVTERAGRTTERRARQRGTFTLASTGRRPKGFGALARDFRRGSWYALLDISSISGATKVRASGTMLATSRRQPAERLCLRMGTTLTTGATVRVRGTFRTLGGTRGARRLRIAGAYDQRAGGRRGWVLRGTSGVGRRTAKPLPRSCRRVAKAFRLR